MLMAGSVGFSDVAVPLPEALRRFGGSTRLRIAGNPDGPAIVVLGGISGNRLVAPNPDGRGGWWPGLVGSGRAIDPECHRIVGLDFAADPTGLCAPSTADQAQVLAEALDRAGLDRVDGIVGASYGAMVALRFAERFAARVGRLVILSAGAEPHPAATAARELQRRLVGLGLATGQGAEALSIARGMAMLTYRTREEFAGRFEGGIDCDDPLAVSAPGAYLRARGEAFCAAMSPERFLSLSASIDRHCARPEAIEAPALLIGATSDQLVPPGQMESLERRLGGPSRLHLIDSPYGHDMFLKQADEVGRIVKPFLENGL
jgi:homoserine O-acetyltransferase